MDNKKTRYNSNLMIVLTILLACGLVIALLSTSSKFSKPIYKKVDRVKMTQREKTKREDKVLGWIKVQGTNIDYPIIFNDIDNGTKLDSIAYNFAWMNDETDKLTNRPLIVGHNIRNVSKNPLVADKEHERFEQLLSFVYLDFAKKNKYIQYTIGDENYLYKIFSIAFVDNDDVEYFDLNFNKRKLKQYIHKSIKDSIFKFSVDVRDDENILTLVTCTRMFGEDADKAFKIDARMVRKDESATNYRVVENDSYKNIKKIMEGDGEDEQDA